MKANLVSSVWSIYQLTWVKWTISWISNSSCRTCILSSAPSFPPRGGTNLNRSHCSRSIIHHGFNHSSRMHGWRVAVPDASTLFMVWHSKSKCIIYGPKWMRLPSVRCLFFQTQSQIAACQKLWSNTIYGSGPTAALIYDSKLKRMKNLWRQFVGSHKTIIELWSGISSLRV